MDFFPFLKVLYDILNSADGCSCCQAVTWNAKTFSHKSWILNFTLLSHFKSLKALVWNLSAIQDGSELFFFFSYCHVIKDFKSFCSSQTSVFFVFFSLLCWHMLWSESHLICLLFFFLVKCVFQYFEENSLPSCKVLQLASTSNYGEPSKCLMKVFSMLCVRVFS